MAIETGYIIDVNLLLKDAGAVTSTNVGTVASVARIIDIGDGNEAGEMVIDVSAIDVASTDEAYEIILEGSDSSDFSTGTPLITALASIHLGAAATIPGAAATSTGTGRFVVPYRNEQNGHRFRYLRVEFVIAGTTPSINFVAFLSKRKW